MGSENVNVRVTGDLRNHLQQQIGQYGLYENASEYIRDLIRRDLKDRKTAWEWLRQELDPGLRTDESQFIRVTSTDVIRRNTKSKRTKP